MAFWIFMLLCCMLTPLLQLLFGFLFVKRPPRQIGGLFGYRTNMSMKNMETWLFAHLYCGRLWFRIGLALLPLTILAMLPVLGKSEDVVGWVGTAVVVIQGVALLLPVFWTERALRRLFDSAGNRRY